MFIRGSFLEAPAHGAVRFGGSDAKRGDRCDDVEVPGRWPGAWRAKRGGESVVARARWPPLSRITLRHILERGLVGHSGCRAFDDEVEGWEAHRDRAIRVLGQVPALASSRAAGEVELPVHPQRADARDVWSPVGAHSRQPERL